MASASRVGTMDPMGKTRVFTDETLREVPAGSAEAAFSWKRSELEARRERRTALGLDKGDEVLRVQIESRKVEAAKAARRAAALQDEADALQAAAKADGRGASPTTDAIAELRSEVAALRKELAASKAAAKKADDGDSGKKADA